jgi:hypothetical protein
VADRANADEAFPGDPVHEHDCGPEHGCRFLGTIPAPAPYIPVDHPVDAPPLLLDLWVHTYPERDSYPYSLIFRSSSEPSDYQSTPYGGSMATPSWLDSDPWREIRLRLDRSTT